MSQQPVQKQVKSELQQKKEDEQQKVEDHILKRFDLLEFKGKGAYGIVWKAIDKKTQQTVALKKIFDAFHNATDSQRTFREVIFLEQLTQHENIVKLLSVIRAENDKDLYMVFEFMETDLHKVVRAGILEDIHKKYVVYQCLKALKYIHSGDLIHRDLKPSNLLINSQCKIKVADFGLARSLQVEEEDLAVMTEYVATRWYRAPEILLGSQNYSKAVDMWSIGCIVGEMLTGKAIFPGNSTLNQLDRIIELLGKPKSDELESIQATLAGNVLTGIQTQKKKSFAQFFGNASEDAINFIRNCLNYNPNKRITVEQALIHPYLKEFQGSEPEIVRDKKIYSLMNDNQKFSVKEYRQSLYNHISQQKKQAHKSLIIRVQKPIERSQASSSPIQKTENKCDQKQSVTESQIVDSTQTVKRSVDAVVETDYNGNKSRKIIHSKAQSQTFIMSQYSSAPIANEKAISCFSQQNISKDQIVDYSSPMQKKKLSDGRIMIPKGAINTSMNNSDVVKIIDNSRQSEQQKQITQSFLPTMEQSPTKPLSRKSSIDKKLRTTFGFVAQQQQQKTEQFAPVTNSNYFLNGNAAQLQRKNSLTKLLQQPKSLQQSSQQNMPQSGVVYQKPKVSMDKTMGEQYKQYMNQKLSMGNTKYDQVFPQKVQLRK